MDFTWAQNYPEVLKICTLFSLSELSSPVRYRYRSLSPLIQEGPQCGLVALAMCFDDPQVKLEILMNEAINKGFTNNGEMFSAQNLAKLAAEYLPHATVKVYNGQLDSIEVKEDLMSGKLLLVPYDTDKNNSPNLQNGRKAHWAVICGAVETSSDFYVLSRHGKAKNVAVWTLSSLSTSNAQLNEIAPYDKNPDFHFIVPDGGIDGHLGLKSKAVVIDLLS